MTPEEVFATIADRPGAAWLDGGPGTDGWSILAWDPVAVVTNGQDWPAIGRAMTRSVAADPTVPFSGGVLGYVGYGAGHHVDAVPRQGPTPEPEVFLARYDGGLCWRHTDQTWHAAGSASFRASADAVLRAARPLPSPPLPSGPASTTVDRGDWEAAVERVLAWIHAGDCYQVNLSRVVRVPRAGDPFDAYRRLRRAGAAYGAFLRVDPRIVIVSNSPELFLRVDGRQVASLPIKGTRPRGATPAEDDRLEAELRDSPKERAELTMIVDLVRNDLGRIAVPGTVHAGQRLLTRHPTVHHASWRVEATLADERDSWDALAATFPPGSVTGAPKVRACQRIAELEPEPRGVYCGAIGAVADGGNAVWSVAIRIAVFDGPDARYHVGGGIVAHSRPSDEWDETVAKELALRRALLRPQEDTDGTRDRRSGEGS